MFRLRSKLAVLMVLTLTPIAVAQPLLEQKLTDPTPMLFDRFGTAVSNDGATALVGNLGAGSVFSYSWNGTTWIPGQEFSGSSVESGDLFGQSLSVSGDVALVGAEGDDDNGSSSGSVYVFRFDGVDWIEEQKLTSDDGQAGDNFGVTCSVRGEVMLVGAVHDDDNGEDSGAAYVFRYDGTNWVQEQKLAASDGSAQDHFGSSVAIDGDVAIVGSRLSDQVATDSGSAYVFRFDGETWLEEQILLPGTLFIEQFYGTAVAVRPNTIAVGAPGDRVTGFSAGAAYLYEFTGGSWIEQDKLIASEVETGDAFGLALSLDMDRLIVGARGDDDGGANAGAAYLYQRQGNGWIENLKLTASDAARADLYGSSVSISGDRILIGASSDDTTVNFAGSAYTYFPGTATNGMFVRGDCGGDNVVGLPDAITGLNFLFLGGQLGCQSACDINDDDTIGLPDIIALLNSLFTAGPDPQPPFPNCGMDPTSGTLSCNASSCP